MKEVEINLTPNRLNRKKINLSKDQLKQVIKVAAFLMKIEKEMGRNDPIFNSRLDLLRYKD